MSLDPPRSADELLGHVLARGRAIQRQEQRRKIMTALAPTLVVLLLGIGAALRPEGSNGPHTGLTAAAAPTTSSSAPGLGEPSTTLPPLDLGTGAPVGGATSTTPSTRPSTTTTAPRVVPTAVFEVKEPDGRYRTAVLRRGATNPVAITAATEDRQWPVLSPDGTRIAFASTQRNLLEKVRPIWELYVIDVDGTGLRQLTSAPLDPGYGSRWPSWAPDGKRVVAACANGTTTPSICTVRIDDLSQHQLAAASYGLIWPRWAPDGGSIVALHQESSSTVSTWIVDPTGAKPPHRTPGPTLGFDGTWAPNWVPGESQLLVDQAVGPSLVNVATGAVTKLRLPGTDFVACGTSQVLYRTAIAFGPAQPGDLVLVGLDGTMPTVVLPKRAANGLIPTGCAIR